MVSGVTHFLHIWPQMWGLEVVQHVGGELPVEGLDQLPLRPQDAEYMNLQQLGSNLEGRGEGPAHGLAAMALKV